MINRVEARPLSSSRNRADFSSRRRHAGRLVAGRRRGLRLSDSTVRLNATWEDFASHRDFYSGHFRRLNPRSASSWARRPA